MENTMNPVFTRTRMILIMIALCLGGAIPLGDLVIIPAAESMYMAFPENVSAVNYILSGPALFCVVACFITGKVLMYVSKKVWMLVGMVLFGVGAICGVMVENPIYMCVMRTLCGLSVGIITPTTIAIIAEVFEKESTRGVMMGLWNCVMAVIGMVFSAVSGTIVATVSWQAVFKIYWFAVPLFIIMLLCLPKTPPDKERIAAKEVETGTAEGTKTPWGKYLYYFVVVFVFMLIIDVIYYMSSVYVADTGLGTAAFAGIMGSCITFGSMAGCLLFGPLYTKCKLILPTAMFLILTLTHFMLGYWISIAAVCVACVLIGVIIGMYQCYYQTFITTAVPEKHVSLGISFVQAGMNLGMFLATYLYFFIAGFLPEGGAPAVMKVLAYASLICTVIAVILYVRRRQALTAEGNSPAA